MKQIRSFVTNTLLLFSLLFANAQTTESDSIIIQRDVTIEKEYVPIIKDAGKINEIPSVVDPEIKQIIVDYSTFSTLMDPKYKLRQLESARLRTPPIPDQKDGFLRLGAGNRWATLGNLMYPLLNKSTHRLDFKLNHNGLLKEKKHHESKGGLTYQKYKEKSELTVDANYEFEGFNYYGDNALDSTTNYIYPIGTTFIGKDFIPEIAGISKWNFSIAYKTIPVEEEYKVLTKIDYKGFSPTIGLTEQLINTQIHYDQKIEENIAGVDVQLKNLIYNNSKINHAFGQNNYAVFKLNPYFAFKQEKWYLKLGIKTFISKDSEGKGFVPTADITGQATLIDKSIYAYGGITGDYQTNSMNYVESINHYINLNRKLKDSYTPFDAYGGFKLKLLYNFLIDLSVRYKINKNQAFFVNDFLIDTNTASIIQANSFSADYQDANLFNTTLKFNYNYNQDLSFILGGKYNSWTVANADYAWHMPKYEIDLGIDMKLSRRTSVNLYSYVATGRKSLGINGNTDSMKSIVDINLGLFYAHSSKVSIFLKMNNLLDSRYEYFNGYEVVGFNALIGLTFSF